MPPPVHISLVAHPAHPAVADRYPEVIQVDRRFLREASPTVLRLDGLDLYIMSWNGTAQYRCRANPWRRFYTDADLVKFHFDMDRTKRLGVEIRAP